VRVRRLKASGRGWARGKRAFFGHENSGGNFGLGFLQRENEYMALPSLDAP
jgi:hypothetical protein